MATDDEWVTWPSAIDLVVEAAAAGRLVCGVVVSCRDVDNAIKDPRWLGLVVHELGTPVIAAEARKAVQTPPGARADR